MTENNCISITLISGLVFHVNGDQEDVENLIGALANESHTSLTFAHPRMVGAGDVGPKTTAITVSTDKILSVEWTAREKCGDELLKELRQYAGDWFVENR